MKTVQPYTVEFYIAPDGRKPILAWLESLKDVTTIRRIRNRIDRFETGNLGDYKAITGYLGLYEARLPFGPGYRIYFALERNRVLLLLAGGIKETQKKDIQTAAGHYRQHLGE